MKTIMKKIDKRIFFLVALVSFLSSCDFDLDKENPNSVIIENFYETKGDLVSAVNATYAVLQDRTLITREWWWLHDLRSDDMATGGGQLETPRYQILIGANDAANYVAKNVWLGWYAVIHRANVVIEKAGDVTMSNEALRDRLVGEAKFLRAMAYFDLVSMWGGVPLYDEYVKDLNASNPKATVDEVYISIISNLQDAIAGLSLNYSGEDIGRATNGAARALLARVYMQRGDYESAKIQLKAIIDSGQYYLVDDYVDNFLEETEYNSESVFEVGYMDSNGLNNGLNHDGLGRETTLHNQDISPITWGNLIPSESLLEEFESTDVAGDTKTDPRYKFSFYEVGDTIVSGPLKESDFNVASSSIRGGTPKKVGWRKHTIIYKYAPKYYSGLNERVIRYAEVLLMMAECQNETGESENDVLTTLNQLRDRVSVMMPHYPTTNYSTATKEDRFKAIVHEKRVELCGEEIRNRDILRWRQQGKLDLIGGDPISYFQPNKYELLPIPQDEINNNPNISSSDQNSGY